MTVAELIAKLRELPQEALVVKSDDYLGLWAIHHLEVLEAHKVVMEPFCYMLPQNAQSIGETVEKEVTKIVNII